MTGRPLGVVTTPLTTLFIVVVPDVDSPISDLDSTVKRDPLDVMTGNETVSTKCISFLLIRWSRLLTEPTKIMDENQKQIAETNLYLCSVDSALK